MKSICGRTSGLPDRRVRPVSRNSNDPGHPPFLPMRSEPAYGTDRIRIMAIIEHDKPAVNLEQVGAPGVVFHTLECHQALGDLSTREAVSPGSRCRCQAVCYIIFRCAAEGDWDILDFDQLRFQCVSRFY